MIPPRVHLAGGGVSEPPEVAERAKMPTRRLIRWAAIVAAVILAVLACWQDPLYAL
jgi:hypothetical protein